MTSSKCPHAGANTPIRYATGTCSLGTFLVGMSSSGICAILLGDDPDSLAQDLRHRFPETEPIDNGREPGQLVAKVVNFIEAPADSFDFPLDIRGTPFQQKVWQALREIPAGATLSYSELARRIGAPKSVRAVAGACAANFLAIAIPCHRVVRNDGSLSGYRWGIERKMKLLRREKTWL